VFGVRWKGRRFLPPNHRYLDLFGKSDAGIFLEVVSLSAEAMTEAFEDEGMIEELYLRKESNEKKLSFPNMQNTEYE
jgi:hypothetical protein